MNGRVTARAAWIAVGALAVFALRLLVSDAGGVGIAFLFVVPVGMAAWWFGRRAGLGVAVGCIALYLAAVALHPVDQVALAVLLRAAVLIIAAVVVAELRTRTERLGVTAGELEALRQALAPVELPRLPGLDAAVCFLPATHGVSGDFYLVTNGPHETNIAIVADVRGHGPQAARTATFARATFASVAANSSDPAEILRLVNHSLAERWPAGEFLTATCVAHHPRTGSVHWATAGHPRPIRLSDLAELPSIANAPLAISLNTQFRAHQAVLVPPDGVLLYTDGLLDARRGRERYGEQRLLGALAECATRPAAEIADTLCRAVSRFAGDDFADDICILVLRATRSAAG